jgi:hypothetical protein
VNNSTTFDKIAEQSSWYGKQARRNHSRYVMLKSTQIVFAASIPVVCIAAPGDVQRWASAALGALIGVIEGFIQLGQYQQNWLLYRATRSALEREVILHSGKAGPYLGASDPDALYIERSDAIVSGEYSRWLASQEQAASTKGTGQIGAS